MSTQHFPIDGASQANGSSETTADAAGQGAQGRLGSTRKARQRSVFLFPAYGFNTALDIARRVEESGGGSLTEETLAIDLGLSVKSSGFRLKSLAARQFQLINKQGDTLTTTPVAKAIFKPTSNADELRGYLDAFQSIPLFQAVADRYRGQRLPDSQTLRNVLEREFHVEHSRVQQAERMLLDSARDAHLLKHTGEGSYLVLSDYGKGAAEELTRHGNGAVDSKASQFGANGGPASPQLEPGSQTNTLTFTTDEIGALSSEEFQEVWRALGILIQARQNHRVEQRPDDDWPDD